MEAEDEEEGGGGGGGEAEAEAEAGEGEGGGGGVDDDGGKAAKKIKIFQDIHYCSSFVEKRNHVKNDRQTSI